MPRLSLSRLVVPVVAAFAVVLSGFVAPSAVAAGNGTITVHVDNEAAEPQSGYVYLYPVGEPNGGGNNLTAGTSTLSRAAGGYHLQVVSRSMDGFSYWYKAGDAAGSPDRDHATVITLEEGQVHPDISITLPVIAKVSGTVLRSDGTAAEGVRVFRTKSDGGGNANTTTDAAGHYDFGYVRQGSWTIGAAASGEWVSTSTILAVPASGEITAPTLTMSHAATIHGTVVDHDTGKPIPLLRVQVFKDDQNHTYTGEVLSGADGRFRITGLAVGQVFVRYLDGHHGYPTVLEGGGDPFSFSGAQALTLAEGADLDLEDVSLTAGAPGALPSHTMSGTVRDVDGDPLVGIDVYGAGTGATTDRWGRWAIDAPAGTHDIVFSPGGDWHSLWYEAPTWYSEALPPTTVSGPGDVHDGLDATLVRSAWIRGSVVGATRVRWQAYGLGGSPVGPVGDNGSGASYKAIVRPGSQRLLVWGTGPSGTRLLPRWVGNVDDQASATTFTLASGDDVDAGAVTAPTSLVATAAPTVLGSPRVGQTLTATNGSWNVVPHTTWTTTWFRGSTPVATGSSYLVRPADAGAVIRARVTAINDGISGTAEATAVLVTRMASRTSLRATSPRRRVVRLTLSVGASGLVPSGTVNIWRGSTVVKRNVRIVGGKAVVTLLRQASRRTAYRVTYNGSTALLPSTSTTVRIRVR